QVLIKTVGNEQTYYVYGLGLIGQEVAGEYSTYHFDLRGSTVAITNANGKVTDRYQYSAYGELLSSTGDTDTPFLFNGRDGVVTDANGLYYMRARYYNPEIRRFVSQDILLGVVIDGQSLNRYAYVQGNPVGFVDPLGLARDGAKKRELDEYWYYKVYGESKKPDNYYKGFYTLIKKPNIDLSRLKANIIDVDTGFGKAGNKWLEVSAINVKSNIGIDAGKGKFEAGVYAKAYLARVTLKKNITVPFVGNKLHIELSGELFSAGGGAVVDKERKKIKGGYGWGIVGFDLLVEDR
ncbi:MAG: RHS repeat-associated core domain-containing protein, partial [Clostridia bacterium]|nr:RHS repeat-associated core domain-containing protein [Clostridia bacterium]